jgi:hypothetical protein
MLNQIATLKANSVKSNREFLPQATLGLQDADGNNVGLLNLTGNRESELIAQQVAEAFVNSVNKMTELQRSVCTFSRIVHPETSKVSYRLANANNRTIGFVNGDKHDLTGWTLNDVTASVYTTICTTEEDFDSLLGV